MCPTAMDLSQEATRPKMGNVVAMSQWAAARRWPCHSGVHDTEICQAAEAGKQYFQADEGRGRQGRTEEGRTGQGRTG